MTNPDDLMQNLLHFPKAPYSCGSAEGWMKKAHDRIEELTAALEKVRSYNVDIAAGRINYRPHDHIQVIDAALQPKAGS